VALLAPATCECHFGADPARHHPPTQSAMSRPKPTISPPTLITDADAAYRVLSKSPRKRWTDWSSWTAFATTAHDAPDVLRRDAAWRACGAPAECLRPESLKWESEGETTLQTTLQTTHEPTHEPAHEPAHEPPHEPTHEPPHEPPHEPTLEPAKVRQRPIHISPRPDLTHKRQSKLKHLENTYKTSVFSTRFERIAQDALLAVEEAEKQNHVKTPSKTTAEMSIHSAAYNGVLSRVIELLASGKAGPNDWDERFGNTAPLHLASMRGHVDIVHHLLSVGADPNARAGPITATPAHYAARFGQLECTHLLYKAGADPTLRDAQGFDCLDLAMHSGDAACVVYLVGVMGSLWQAAFYGVVPRAAYLLSNGLANVDAVWESERAEETHRASSVRDATFGPNQGVTALHLACIRGHVSMVGFLLERGADPNRASAAPRCAAPLHVCSMAPKDSQVPICRLLLSAGADPRRQDGRGFNALVAAKMKGLDTRAMCEVLVSKDGGGMDDATEGVGFDFEKELPRVPPVASSDGIGSVAMPLGASPKRRGGE